MKAYWLLTSHVLCVYPIIVCYLEYKAYKKIQSIYLLTNILLATLFSVMYHTKDYHLVVIPNTAHTWTLLDRWESSALVVNTLLYSSNYRSNYFYVNSYVSNTLLMMLQLLSPEISLFMLYICCSLLALMKYKTYIYYICQQKLLTIVTAIFLILSITFFTLANVYNQSYTPLHSAWHFCIYTTCGLCCTLRYRYNQFLTSSTSIEMINITTPRNRRPASLSI